MTHPLERWKKTSGDGPSATIGLEDWNGVLDAAGNLLVQLVQKGADFDAVANTVQGVLLDRINGVLGPAYDQVAARALQVETLYAQLTGQGVAAAAIVTDETHRFLTDAQISDLQARVTVAQLASAIAGIKGSADAAHDTLGELVALVDAATAGVAANAATLALKADRDAVPSLDAFLSQLIELAELQGRPFGTVNGLVDPFGDLSYVDTANSLNATLLSSTIVNQAADNFTRALLHFDGANLGTTFTDEAGHTFTAAGGAKLSTGWSAFGTASGVFTASGDYVSGSHADFVLGTNDFSIELRVRPNSIGALQTLYEGRNSGGSNGLALFINSSGKLTVLDAIAGAYVLTGTTTLASGSAYTVQVSRASGTMRLLVAASGANAAVEASATVTSNFTNPGLRIGNNFDGSLPAISNIDEFRLSNTPRNTSTYTPATTAFALGTSGLLRLRSIPVKMTAGVPNRAYMLVIAKATAGTITPATMIGSVSRNAGAAGSFKALSLAAVGPYGAGYTLYRAPWTDITGVASGDQLVGDLSTNDNALGVAVRSWAILGAA